MKDDATRLSMRNIGIDLLRLFCMYMIVVHHLLWHGGLLFQAEPDSASYNCAWILNTLCYCAVNAFGIISGLVGYQSRHSLRNLARLWFSVFFWGLGLGCIGYVLRILPFSLLGLMRFCFPVTFGLYWYFSAYCCLYFVMPAIDVVVEHLPGKRLATILLALMFLFFVADKFQTNIGVSYGHSFIWLAYLYLVGATMAKYNICAKVSESYKHVAIIGYVLTSILIFVLHLLLSELARLCSRQYDGWLFSNYNSPLMLLEAVFLVVWFHELDLKAIGRWMAGASSCAFGVYIIHQHPTVVKALFMDKTAWMLNINPCLMLLYILLLGG